MTFHTSIWIGPDGNRTPFEPLPEFYHSCNDIKEHRRAILALFVPEMETEVLFITREAEMEL